jgi:RNA polymerase sigma factor FliA
MRPAKQPCPEELRPLVQHADRLARFLRKMERDRTEDAWLIGRSKELRTYVHSAIADWHAGRFDSDGARADIQRYIDGLHRGAARRLECAPTLDCCEDDEAITVPLDGEEADAAADTGTNVEGDTLTTQWHPFQDPPEVTERFERARPCVEAQVKILAARFGTRTATLDDLRVYALAGLHDAARTFDERRGVPFAQWAKRRIRQHTIDGLRKQGVPRSVMRRLRGVEAAAVLEATRDSIGGRRPGTPQGADEELSEQLADEVTAMALADAAQEDGTLRAVGSSPEEIVSKRELCSLVRDLVKKLPQAERTVVEGYFFDERNLREVGRMAGASESWACRKLARGVRKVQRKLQECGVELDPRTVRESR